MADREFSHRWKYLTILKLTFDPIIANNTVHNLGEFYQNESTKEISYDSFKNMWGLELPYRRYSVPETVMRKFRLRQSSSSSSDSSGRRVTRRPAARVRYGRSRPGAALVTSTLTKGVQTAASQNDDEERCTAEAKSFHGKRRAISVPDLSSDADTKADSERPLSASDKIIATCRHVCNGPSSSVITPLGTPSPNPPSNHSSAFNKCDIYSNSWSYTTSSEYTLNQTVSDRTTSTQDSTLSIQSSTPESASSNSFYADMTKQRMFLENSIFSPAGNFIAVHTESLLIQPIEIVERRENWTFGFSDTPESEKLVALPDYYKSIAINTEPPEMLSAAMVDKSTCAYGVFNDKSAQVKDSDIENEQMRDKCTSVEVLNEPKEKYSEIGINTEIQCKICADSKESLAHRRGIFRIPNIKIFKGSTTTESQQTEIEDAKVYVSKGTSIDEKHLAENQNKYCKFCTAQQIINETRKTTSTKSYERRLCADVACAGCNYKDLTTTNVDGVIARYSAVPRSNSMLVNTSSIDYSSDSDLSLTDSLEDSSYAAGTEQHFNDNNYRSDNKFDKRLARGEVTLDENKTAAVAAKKLPKDSKAYAYFLSITGEQDMVRQYSLPDWLKARLKKREEEIKKLFQIRLNKNQTLVYRRRKKTLRKIQENEDSNSPNTPKQVKFTEETNKPRKSTDKQALKEEKLTKTDKNNPKESKTNTEQSKLDTVVTSCGIQQNQKDNDNTVVTSSGAQQNQNDNDFIQISETIKIEMLNSLNTIVTKEKKINLNQSSLTNGNINNKTIQSSEFINNEKNLNSQKIILKTNIGNFDAENNNNNNNCNKVPESNNNKINNKNNVKALFENNNNKNNTSYSFKQFRPLFQSKADDQTVAEILLSAMRNNEEAENKKHTAETQYELNSAENNVKVEKSSNTISPYLSTFIQTNESFLKDKQISDSAECSKLTENSVSVQTNNDDDETLKIKNISSSVQTTETFLKNEIYFIESDSAVKSRDQGTDIFQLSSTDCTEDEHENEAVSVSIQTEQNSSTINEVKPLIVRNKTEEIKGIIKNDDNDNKNFTSNRKSSTTTRVRKHFCKNNQVLSDNNSSQVLELNPEPCTCHMCTLNKKTGVKFENKVDTRRKLPNTPKGNPTDPKDDRKTYQKYTKRSASLNRFQRKFEVIPEEEKNSSSETMDEVQAKLNLATRKINKTDEFPMENANKTENFPVKSTQTVSGVQKKKSNLVFGRFKAIKNEVNETEAKLLGGDGIEVLQQYKGRAALANAPVDGQEQLLTLSKGWINFYLLNDNQDLSDTNHDEVQTIQNESFVQRGVSPIRILKGTEIKEEQIEEFTVEIRATPEPFQNICEKPAPILLPNLTHNQHEMKKRKSIKPQLQNTVQLPEINTSSSSSTPENLTDRIVPVEMKSKKYHHPPLPVVNGRRKSSRHEIRMKRQSVTAYEKLPKHEPLLNLAEEFASGFDKTHTTKAVEVALSEHSVSSITSSTIILSESPSPRPHRKSRHRPQSHQPVSMNQPAAVDSQNERNDNDSHIILPLESGSSWTVTVAGSSGNHNHTPPDVEMRLTFGNKQSSNNNKDRYNEDENERRLVNFNPKKSTHSATAGTSKRKGRMIEEYAHAHSSRNERKSLQYLPAMLLQNSQNSKSELSSHNVCHKDIGGYMDQDNTSQFSRRSKGSAEGGSSDVTSLCSDLQVTGLAITPENKPYVPTQSERDLVRRQRYKFTR